MRLSGDYKGEMPKDRFSESDIEVLLSGEQPDDPDLALLGPFVEALRRLSTETPSEDTVARLAAVSAGIAREAGSNQGRTVRVSKRPVFRPRFAGVLGVMALLVGMTGVAMASDSAAPGDALYGIDRALEVVGVGAGGAAERLGEASALAIHGKSAEALEHAAQAVAGTDDQASQALHSAAERIRALGEGGDNAVGVRAEVAAMLDWMTTTEAKGKDFGQGVAERARGLGKGSPSGAGSGEPDHPQGPPDGMPPGSQRPSTG